MGNAQSDLENAFDPSKNGTTAVIQKITNGFDDMTKGFDDMTKGFESMKNWFDDFPDMITKLFTQTLKTVIWDPIDNALIKPATNFFETIIMYINCSLNKIENFWGCFFWYVVYVLQETLNLIIVGALEIIRSLTSIDLLPLYYQALDGYGYVSDIFSEYTGFELFIFPYSDQINAKCFVCQGEIKESKLKVLTKDIKEEIKKKRQVFTDFTKDLANQIT